MICYLINRKGFHYSAQILGSLEIIFHAWLAVILIGWSSGFHYYILSIVPIALFSPKRNFSFKLIIVLLFFASYLGLNIYSNFSIPIYILNNIIITGFNYMNIIGIFLILFLLAYFYYKTVRETENELIQTNKHFEELASIDSLTKLLNRRSILDIIKNEEIRFKRSGKPFVIMIIDIDDFKRFNDQYGHDCGNLY